MRPVCGVDAESLGSFDVVGEEIPDDLLVVGSPGLWRAVALHDHDLSILLHRTVFRRPSGGSDEFAVGAFHEEILPILEEFLERGVGAGFEKLPVAGEFVVRPKMLGQPGAAGAVDAPGGVASHRVVGAVGDPSALGGDGGLGVLLSNSGKVAQPVEERLVAFG